MYLCAHNININIKLIIIGTDRGLAGAETLSQDKIEEREPYGPLFIYAKIEI